MDLGGGGKSGALARDSALWFLGDGAGTFATVNV